jgi:sulfite reductase (NADPH) hemoprotein beta-component
VENYQITLGGDPGDRTALGERLGPGIDGDQVPDAIERIVDIYLSLRDGEGEAFIDTVRRVGLDPFKRALQPKETILAAA